MNYISTLLAAARGDVPSDVLIKGGRLINVFSGEIDEVDIAISGGRIAGLGAGYQAKEQIDVKGSFISPGFIDAHVHVESSLCTPAQFSVAVVPRGVTTVVSDPHEIANVAGVEGVRFMAKCARGLALNLILMAPSCVPATHLASSGATIDAADLTSMRQQGITHGLAEVMNYVAVSRGDDSMLSKIATMRGRPVDGHCPSMTGRLLNAYAAAGVGSDHESTTPDEAREKLARGLYVMVREATNARNLSAILPMINRANSRRICFCTDDRTSCHLLDEGSIDEMLRRSIEAGIDPIDAIRMVTLNPAEWFWLGDVGAIGPGRRADLVVFDDLRRPHARLVFSQGVLAAREGVMLNPPAAGATADDAGALGKCDIAWDRVNFELPAKSDRIRVIGAQQDQLATEHRVLRCRVVEKQAVADVGRDILKMAVIERHRRSGNMGVGFIQAFGFKRGAIAGTVAHDHHNLVTIGCDDVSMRAAAQAAAAEGGGLAVAVGENIVARMALPIGGLMSNEPIEKIATGYRRLVGAARELGSSLSDPFMAMSFMALEVIPSLKLTDQGLIDVEKFQVVDLFV
jgi:adenine deaminase